MCTRARRSSCPRFSASRLASRSAVHGFAPRQSARGPRSRLPRHVGQRSDCEPGAGGAARAARRRSLALRLRRGDTAAADALDGRPAGHRGDLHHAFPRRPLPRPAGNAEDLPAPSAGAPADGVRAAGPSRPVRRPAARVREGLVRARARGGAGRGRRSSATTTASSSSPSTTAPPRSATHWSSTSVPGASTTTRPMRSGFRSGRSGGPCSTVSR